MPAWLKDPAPASSGGWKYTVALWGGSLVALVVVFGAAMWLFDQHQTDSPMPVAARATAPVAAADPVVPARKESALPPMVLLAPAPAKPVAQVAVPELPAPVAIAEKPVAKAAPKPAPTQKVALAERAAAPARPKAKAKAPAGITLPPARERRLAAEPPRENTPSKCQRGELARECAARNGSY